MRVALLLIDIAILDKEDETVKKIFWSGESIFCPTSHWSTKENGRIPLFRGV